jgi:hypothetical protein
MEPFEVVADGVGGQVVISEPQLFLPKTTSQPHPRIGILLAYVYIDITKPFCEFGGSATASSPVVDHGRDDYPIQLLPSILLP